MKKKRFTEEQIIAVLKEHELGATAAELGRKHGISPQTLYDWKSKYDGMDVSEAKRLKGLETENAKLKRMYADLALDPSPSACAVAQFGGPLSAGPSTINWKVPESLKLVHGDKPTDLRLVVGTMDAARRMWVVAERLPQHSKLLFMPVPKDSGPD